MGRKRTAGGRRRTIGAARAACAVLTVAGTALAALLLRPGTSLLTKGRGPLGGNPVLLAGLALAAFFGGLALRERYQTRVGAGRELSAVEQRMADGVGRILLGASLVVPLLVLVLHRTGPSGDGQEPAPPPDPQPAPSEGVEGVGGGTALEMTPVLLGLGIALLVLVGVVLVIAGRHLWRHLARLSPPRAPAATYATPADERERLVQAVDSGRRALLDGTDARAAVIACYAAMEKSLADSGVPRHASDSPQDLLERAAAGGLPAGTAAAALTALFREARYSTHPMDDGHRGRAAAALAEIADGLRTRAPGPTARTETS